MKGLEKCFSEQRELGGGHRGKPGDMETQGEGLRYGRWEEGQPWIESQCSSQRPRPAKEVRRTRAMAGVGRGAGLLQLSLLQQVVL